MAEEAKAQGPFGHSSRGPRHAASAQNMEVEMADRLPPIFSHIGDHPVSALCKARISCHLGTG